MQSFGGGAGDGRPSTAAYIGAGVTPLCLVVRRRFPLITLIVASAVFVPMFYMATTVSVSVVFQVSYFTAIYTAVAWSRSRRAVWVVNLVVVVSFTSWLMLTWVGSEDILHDLQENGAEPAGPFDPVLAYAVYATAINLAYVCGAAAFGRASWRAALRRYRLEGQARTIRSQSHRLAQNAVAEERLRLARDLHDSIGHHFTGVGLQAGGARRILAAGDDGRTVRLNEAQSKLVRDSLEAIETSTREGIGELQTVLRLLRESDNRDEYVGTVTGESKTIQDLPQLAKNFESMGLRVRLSVSAEDGKTLEGPGLSAILHHGVYRMVQESLTNVLKHSDATEAQVLLRASWTTNELEVEVADRGNPVRPEDHGLAPSTGSGLRGVEERASVLGGKAVYGPLTPWPGWKTRFTVPLHDAQPSPEKEPA
ncbi:MULTISPECIES: sensor histidine kinase [Micrococcaceae]|uniref:sensor histidine kinase n=1 Tax=unclassified Kocuria TaxID=2649579 RepID=UPI001012672F|nr:MULTISPECIES: histidine kinase [unclassified Kocuria]